MIGSIQIRYMPTGSIKLKFLRISLGLQYYGVFRFVIFPNHWYCNDTSCGSKSQKRGITRNGLVEPPAGEEPREREEGIRLVRMSEVNAASPSWFLERLPVGCSIDVVENSEPLLVRPS